MSRSLKFLRKATRNTNLAIEHFDGLYGKVYGRSWPSMRLGLLTPKKQCAILNSFEDTDHLQEKLTQELNAIDLQYYYKKHLFSYTRWQLRKQIIDNKKARKRELIARDRNVDVESITLDSIEVSDVSDSELKVPMTTDASDGFSSAQDLHEMFSDRRMDDDEKYFINRASTQLSLNDYVPASELIYREEHLDESSYYGDFEAEEEPVVEIREEPSFEVDPSLKIFTFPRNVWSQFEPPTSIGKSHIQSHYLLDGASLLSILALDLRPNEVCADYCAAPGGKSLAMLMTLKPSYLLCNDNSSSRLARLLRIVKQYIPEVSYVKSTLKVTKFDARSMVYRDTFDKILVDAPCTNDRNSIEALENNIFKRSRTEERLQLPKVQCSILTSALKSLKPKGAVVYSTCTMSPFENDGVVSKALSNLLEENFPAKFAVMNLKEAFRPFRGLFKFNTKFTYGQQVTPSVCSNFGPMYISKIKRVS